LNAQPSSQVGTAIFSFVIAAHTFSLLFLRHQWSDRTCYVILGVSWASLLLEMCIENFILAEPTKIGPYYGVAGYWCWITSMYTVARYATSYLLMFISAALSFILYLLVFFRLRGNISVSAGYKIYVHRSPKLRVGRTSDGTYIITDDRRVESHLTRVAKHMLWYPLAYTVLVLPMAASRFSAFSGASVPFSVTIVTASVFMLHGCVNTLLFCTTRNILPGSWRQRFGLGTTWDGGRGDLNQSTRTNATWQFTGVRARIGAVNTSIAPTVLSVDVEKDVGIQYDEAQPSPSYLKFGSPSSPATPTSPTPLLRVYGGSGPLADTHKHYIRHPSFLIPRDARTSIRTEEDRDGGDSDFSAGVDPELKAKLVELQAPPQPLGYASREHPSGISGLAPGLQVPASAYLFSTNPPSDNHDKRQSYSPSIPTSETTRDPARFSREF